MTWTYSKQWLEPKSTEWKTDMASETNMVPQTEQKYDRTNVTP